MVSNIKLLQIHKQLNELFGCLEEIPFTGKAVILVADLLQLPPVKAPNVLSEYNSIFGSIFSYRSYLKYLN